MAGFSISESTALLENIPLVLRSLDEDLELPPITKATLSVSMTHKKMASIYAKVSVTPCRLNLRVFTALCVVFNTLFCLSVPQISKTSSGLPSSTTPTP